MPASAGDFTVSGTGELIFDQERGATTVVVRVPSTSAEDALVNVPSLHEPGDFIRIPKGEMQHFRLNNGGIRKVFVKGDGGNATVYFGIVSRT